MNVSIEYRISNSFGNVWTFRGKKNCQIEIFRRNALEAKKKITIINSRLTNLNKLVILYQIICPPSESDPKKMLSHFLKLTNA